MRIEHDVALQPDGWPTGVAEGDKEALTAIAREVLTELPHPVERWILLGRFTQRLERALPAFRISPLYDFQYAVLDRACRAAGAELMYVLPKRSG